MPIDPISGMLKLRFIDPLGATMSRCRIADIKLIGWVQVETNNALATDLQCSVGLSVNGNAQTPLSNIVTYKQSLTPIVTTVSPMYGPSAGGTEVTITGTGFSETETENMVMIDDVECVVS
jgi:hypothetical protein